MAWTPQVVEIMLNFLDSKDWHAALVKAIPKRKRDADDEDDSEDGDQASGKDCVLLPLLLTLTKCNICCVHSTLRICSSLTLRSPHMGPSGPDTPPVALLL